MSARATAISAEKTASSARNVPGNAERFFQWSLYLMVVVGFAALMGTNHLDLPSLALVLPALLLRGIFLLMRKTVLIPERWTSMLTILYFAFYAADYFYFSQSFINATVHMVLFIMVVKIFSVRRDRDLLYLAVLSFLMILSAAVLTVDTLFLLTFSVFILVSIATFISMEMRRSEREAIVAQVPQRQDTQFHGWLSGMAAVLGILTLAGAALIFFILPRINSNGYLRNLGMQSGMMSGFSQEVDLGGIGRIQQSNNVVMHVQILDGKMPENAKWRGIALASFDGRRWYNPVDFPTIHGMPLDLTHVSNFSYYSDDSVPHLSNFSYRVVMEPTGLNLFFLAPVPLKLSGDYRMLEIRSDGSIFNIRPAESGYSLGESENSQAVGAYSAEADTRDPEPYVRDSNSRNYPPHVAVLYLQMPRLDPRIPQLARQITADAGSNYTRAKALEQYLHNNFGYTLELPGMREGDPLAHFLFERKRGHCEYFASSMVIMLRTLGIPSRVVNGFRGGEYNDLTGSYVVRERDAHSWVEAYFPEYGWVTFDPTPAGSGSAPATGWSRLSLYMDAAQQLWREWIINYDFSHQMHLRAEISNKTGSAQSSFRAWLLRKYRQIVSLTAEWQQRLERLSPAEMALCCVLIGLLLALPFMPKAWRSFQRRRMLRNPELAPRTSASFWYMRMLKMMAKRGVKKTSAQTAEEFTASIPDPHMQLDVALFTEHYERARFNESVEDAQRLPELYEEMAGRK